MRDSIFADKGSGLFPVNDNIPDIALAAFLSTRVVSYLLRVTTQALQFREGYVAQLPTPEFPKTLAVKLGSQAILEKSSLVYTDSCERHFTRATLEGHDIRGTDAINTIIEQIEGVMSRLLTVEAAIESVVAASYELSDHDLESVLAETNPPAGWYPLVSGYDDLLPDLTEEVIDYVQNLSRQSLSRKHFDHIKDTLRLLYQAGPGAKVELPSDDATDDEAEDAIGGPGANIPIPAETFLEEISQKLEIHPISVYWLLKEMREQEGLVCPPEIKRHFEDYVSVTILRLLGYRWPEQDAYEQEHGPILDPDLVVADGIIPLVEGTGAVTALDLVRARLTRQFGEDGALKSEREFRQWAGRELDAWLERDFFHRHIRWFKSRPIAWHFTSPEGTFQAYVLYHTLSRETLRRLRTQYAGALLNRLQAERERARARNDEADASKLNLQIEDIEEFREMIAAIERGDNLEHRIRCRWKDEEAEGRPGPYAPDIDDGVKVNIRPFQDTGLLTKKVINKW